MRKQILNLGKTLSASEQKEIFGGEGILPVVYSEECSTPDSLTPPGCPCSSSSECSYTGIVDPKWTLAEFANQRGTCTAGTCH